MKRRCAPFFGRIRCWKNSKDDNNTPPETGPNRDGLRNQDAMPNSSSTQITQPPTNPPPIPHSVAIVVQGDGSDQGSHEGPATDRPRDSTTSRDLRAPQSDTRNLGSLGGQRPDQVAQATSQPTSDGAFAADELQERLGKYQKLMFGKFSSPSQVLEDDPRRENYISLRSLREILTEVDLDNFFKSYSWYKKHHLQQLYNDYLCIIATLIDIGWRDWSRFGDLFFAYRMEGKKPKKVRRDDGSLPFMQDDLADIFPNNQPLQRAFREDQFKFKHWVLRQDDDREEELPWNTRLPFTQKTAVRPYERDGNGSSRPVYKVEIIPYGLKLRTPRYKRRDNSDPELVAMKVFRYRSEFDKENNAQKMIKVNRPNYDHIVISYTSFHYRNEHYILYPWADGDLQSLCYGAFPGFFKLAQGRFKPDLILKQLQGLAQGLDDLHRRYSLRHFDLKLENIFVYDLDIEVETDGDEQGAGQWRIGDFGLAEERIPQSMSSLAVPANAMAERSSRDAPRNPGAYQAPEMRPGGSVNHHTDNFSLGCIMAVCYVFILGGPIQVLEFKSVRCRGYESDQFFATIEGGRYQIKPEIFEWLRTLRSSKGDLNSEWRHEFITCIEALLIIDRDQRLDAQEAAQRLGTLSAHLKGLAQLWDYTRPHARVVKETRSDPTLSLTQSSLSPDSDRMRQEGLDEAIIARSVPGFPPPHNVLKIPMFTRLHIFENVLDVKLNSCWVAFVRSDRVLIYDLKRLVQANQIWHQQRPTSRESAERQLVPNPCMIICNTEGSRFISVYLADSYVALVTAPVTNPDNRLLEFRDLKWSEHQSGVVSDHIRHIPIHKECVDILLSAQGTLALAFRDHMELLFHTTHTTRSSIVRNRPSRMNIKEPDATFRSAAFSDDGSYLCTWHSSNINTWRIWKVDTAEGQATRKHWRYASSFIPSNVPTDFQEPKSDLIISACCGEGDSAYFYVFDKEKRIWLIGPGGSEKIEPSREGCTVGRLGTSLPGKAVFMLGDIMSGNVVSLDVISGIPGPNRMAQSQVEMVNGWQDLELASNAALGGFVRRIVDGKHVFVISQVDGSLVLIPIA